MSARYASADAAEHAVNGGEPRLPCSCTVVSWPTVDGEVVVLRVAGEVDLLTLPALRAALHAAVGAGPRHVVVDLAGVTFCSVGGLTLLVEAGPTAAGSGTGYALSGLPPRLDRVLGILWAGALPIRYRSVAAAVTSIRACLPLNAGGRAGPPGSARDTTVRTRPDTVPLDEPLVAVRAATTPGT